MFNLEYEIKDNAVPYVRRLQAAAKSKALREVMGRSGRNIIRDHLERLGRTRHRPHVAHSFFQRAADATSFTTQSDGATVVIAQEGIAQRRYGGRIELRNFEWFAIPVDIESEGRTAREFPNLEWITNKRTRKGVAKDPRSGKVLFALRQDPIDQDPDPTVLPTDSEILDHISDDVARFMDRYWNK